MVLAAGNTDIINVRLFIEYDGSNYFGWQKQKSRPSVQSAIEDSLKKLLQQDVTLTGAGRTDTGVHALEQVANFKIAGDSFNVKKTDSFVYSLNSILPKDISILKADFVKPNFSARYSAKKRVYRYLFTLKKPAIEREHIYYCKNSFDLNIAKKFCKFITGTYSFKTLCKNKSDKNNFLSKIYYAKLNLKDDIYQFEICGIRFLHSMVRAVVGAMLKVSSGKLPLNEFIQHFKNEERINIQYVPSYALYLKKVIY